MEFCKLHWKTFLPIVVAIVIAIVMYNRPQIFFPPKKPSFVIDTLIFQPIPIKTANKSPVNYKTNSKIINPDDKFKTKIEVEFDSTRTKMRFKITGKTDDVYINPKFDLLMKIKNIGDDAGQLIGVFIGSKFVKNTFLRDYYYKQKNIENKSTTSVDSSITTILPLQTTDYLYPDLSLDFSVNQNDNTILIHLLILYSDGNGVIYDTYYWYTYKNLNPNLDSLFDFEKNTKFEKRNDSTYVVKFPIRPDSLTYNIDDFIKYVKKEHLPPYKLSESELKVFESLIPKK